MDPIQQTFSILDSTSVRLVGLPRAKEVTNRVGPRMYLHGGPPLTIDQIPGPTRGALVGALLFEDEAADHQEANAIIDAGDLEISSCHDAGGVGAVAGIVTPNMPVIHVETDRASTAFSPINEGLGKVLRYGSNDESTLDRLRWIRDVSAPLFDRAIKASEPLEITEIQAEGLRRGDECHNRNVASTATLLLRLAPALIRAARRDEPTDEVLATASANPHFFLSFSIATAKAITDAAHNVPGSPIVTAMSANGRVFGVRVSGLGSEWFTCEPPLGNPKLFEGYQLSDAHAAVGDSAVMETVGLGAFALACAPAIASFIGSDPRESVRLTEEMRTITAGNSSRFLSPYEGFIGTPVGIDVNKVADLGVAPLINMGVAHKEPGVGQIGAGLTRLSLEPFIAASRALAEQTQGQVATPSYERNR